jgi:hypothetical protein
VAYEGPEYWYVIYKAVADFGDLMRQAAQAKATLQGMADAVKAESAAEVAGALKAAEARKQDVTAIQQESVALSQLAAAAKSTNVQLLYGGRNDMQQHLADMANQLQYQTLLNRAQWLGFSTVQQAMAYRQQMYQQALLDNKASFAGYLTADQYLAYLQKRTSGANLEAAAIKARAMAVMDETSAYLAYANVVQGTHQSVGQLGEGLSAAASYASALTGLPSLVVTQATFDDSRALAQIAGYRAALGSLPRTESMDILSAATRLGGIPLTGERVPVPVQATPVLGQASVSSLLNSYRPELAAESSVQSQSIDELAVRNLMEKVTEFSESPQAPALPAASPGDKSYTDDEWSALVSRVGAFYDALEAADSLALRTGSDFAPNPADAEGWKQLAFEIGGMGGAVDEAAKAGGWQQLALDIEYFDEPRITTPVFDATEAGKEVERYMYLLDEIPELEIIEAELVDEEAEADLRSFVDDLLSAVRNRYAFLAELDDTEAMAELATFMDVLRDARAEEEKLFAGSGGASGGGGGGSPPLGGAPDPGDFEPDPDDAAAWDALRDAQDRTNLSAEQLIAQLIALAHAAAAAGDAASASRYAWSANVFQTAWVKAAGTSAEDTVLQFLNLAAAAGKAADAAKFANAAQQLMSGGLFNTRNEAYEAGQALINVADAANKAGEAAQSSGGRWGFLTKQVSLWSGLFGSTELIGQVAGWHIALDGVIEVLALWVPAVSTAVTALVGGAIASFNAWQKVYYQFKDLNVVSGALGQKIAPLTSNFSNLEASVRPQVFELLGDYLDAANNKTGTFNNLISATGDYLDRFAAKIVVDMQSGGNGLANFFAVGEKDLALIGQGFDSIGQIFAKLIQATAITHIAEDLAAVGDAILKVVADIFKITPTPVLVFLLAAHGIILWGGLAASAIGKVVIAVASLTSKFNLLNGVSMSVAQFLGATDAQLVKIAANSAAVEDVMAVMGSTATEEAVANLSVQISKTGVGISQFVESAGPGSAARLATFSAGLGDAERETVALGIAAGASDAQLASLAGKLGATGEEGAAAAGGTGMLSGAFSALADIPVVGWIILVAAALAGLGVWLGLRTNQTQAWIESLDSAISKSSSLTVVSTTVSNLAAVTTELSVAQRTGVGDSTELANAHADLTSKLGEELDHVGSLSTAYGVSFVGALNLLNAAGVKTSDIYSNQSKVWDEAEQQVKGLVSGYQAMGQQMGAIGEDLNALGIEQSSQLKDMQSLNTAYDDWTKIVSAAPSAFIAMDQGFATFWTDAKAVGATMTGLSASSLTLQSDFQSNYSNVETFFDAFRSDQAITGTGNFTQFVKDAVASLIPMADGSKEAAAQISSLAQEAGGPATDSIQELQRWVGSIYDPLTKMYDASNSAAIAASSLSQDASRLSNTLQSDLDPAMANAIFNAHGGQQVFQEFATALDKSGPSSKNTVAAAHNVAVELLAIMGNSVSAKSQFVGFAEAMGLSSGQADKLWAEASKHISTNLGSVRSSLAKTASTSADLVKRGEWGNLEHWFEAVWDGIADWFSNSLPHAFELGWDRTASFFVAAFKAIPKYWDEAWSDIASPVVHAFDNVKSIITGGFDGWWAGHGTEVEVVWAGVTSYIATKWDATFSALSRGGGNFVAGVAGMGGDIRKAWDHVLSFLSSSGIDAAVSGLAGAFGNIGSLWVTELEGDFKGLWAFIQAGFRALWAIAIAQLKVSWDTLVFVFSEILDLITGNWGQAWTDMKNYGIQVWHAVNGAADEVFGAMEKAAIQTWNAAFKPVLDFINTYLIQPLANFFESTVPGWWDGFRHQAASTWDSAWTDFKVLFIDPLTGFFETDVPGWFDDFTRFAARAWDTVWGDFQSSILKPLSNFFAVTVPNAVSTGFKDAVNWVITNVLNRVIGYVNDVLGVIPGVPKIGLVHTLAAGGGVMSSRMAMAGSVPGTGDEDGTHALLMGGEWVLRKPARMALQATYGPDFLPMLNNADSWLGGGSRGNLASQSPGGPYRYGGGGLLGDVEGFLSGVGSVLSGGAKGLTNLVAGGVGELNKLIGKGAEAVFNGVWDSTVSPILNLVPGGSITGDVVHGAGADIKSGLDKYLTGVDSKAAAQANASAPGAMGGPTSASAAQAQDYARGRLSSYGWDSGQMPYLIALWNQESGWNRFADNPSSGAYGIPQALPSSKMGAAANPPLSSMAAQVNWGLGYIAQQYGDPQAAEAHELADHWYARGGGVPLGMDNAQEWTYYSRLLRSAQATQASAFWALNAAKLPTGKGKATHAQWAGWYADLLVMQAQQAKVNRAWEVISGGLSSPGSLSQADWTNYMAQLGVMKQWEAGDSPPSSTWGAEIGHPWPEDTRIKAIQGLVDSDQSKLTSAEALLARLRGEKWTTSVQNQAKAAETQVAQDKLRLAAAQRVLQDYKFIPGRVRPSGWAGWKYENGLWGRANDETSQLMKDVSGASLAWHQLYGGVTGAGGTGTPGVLVTPSGGAPSPVNLTSLIPAGPGTPTRATGPSASTTGMGFAAGGSVADLAAMFSFGSPAVPSMALSALGQGMQRQLASAAQPRTLSEAAGDRIGVKVGALTINNPLPEKPSDSIARSSNRLSFLAGRGAV